MLEQRQNSRMRMFFFLSMFLAVFPVCGLAQSISHNNSRFLPLSVGGFLTLGGEGGDAKQVDPVSAGAVGAYLESLHYRFHPGLEVRGEAGGGVLGTLTGPRVSYWFDDGAVSVYMASLFGPQHVVSITYANSQLATQDVEGITSKGVVGVDLFPPQHPHVGMRVEYSQGTFTGIPNQRPRYVLAGIVFRFP